MSVDPIASFSELRERVRTVPLFEVSGRVASVEGNVIEVQGLSAPVGALCRIECAAEDPLDAEVVGFRDGRLRLLPLRESIGVVPGASVHRASTRPNVPRARACLGRVIDGRGLPIDGGPAVFERSSTGLTGRSRDVLDRARVSQPLDVGIRAINALTTVGRGARVGLFAGSGVGKSTLLGQITRFTQADAIVVGLVGERGREVREFVERELGDALPRSIVVVATSQEPAVLRKRAADLAAALAEDLCNEGSHVLLLVDSLSRYCAAQREIGLAAGEPPATRGYPPSVWSTLPKLLERAGTTRDRGSVTGIFTVLVEGDDLQEPVADAARSLLDGHVVLSRRLAEAGQFPAIDALASVSRVMPDVIGETELSLATRARQLLATWADAEDLISIGAYVAGSRPEVDEARRLHEPLMGFLSQGRDQACDLAASRTALEAALAGGAP